MNAIVLEAAARSAVLIVVAWLALILLRVRNLHIQKALWITIVVASLAMPWLLQVHIIPAISATLMPLTIGASGASPVQSMTTQAFWNVVYLVPVVFLLLRLAVGWSRMGRIRREAPALRARWAVGGDVRVSAAVSSPATFGKTILLPEDFSTWSDFKLTAVMAHERAHVLNGDCYMLWLARLTTCVFWFNPLIWWVARRLSTLAEQTSDEAAVERLGSRAEYAEILLRLGEQRSSPLAAAMAHSNVATRIERILSGAALSPALRRSHWAFVVAAALPAVGIAAVPLPTAAAIAGRAHTSAAVPQTASAAPRVVSWGPLASYYPPEAKHKGIDGVVKLAVTLDRQGRATDTKILTERPLNMGFGAAASAAAHAMQYSNPTGHPVMFAVLVKFALSRDSRRATGSVPHS